MELYIEKEFLDNFEIMNDDGQIYKIIKSLLTEYGDKTVFMDISISSSEELSHLKLDNETFALICALDKAPTPIDSIKEHLFEKSEFEQTIVFMNEPQLWFDDARRKGALCFSFETYLDKIDFILKNVDFEYDLSQGFKGWSSIQIVKELPYNKINIVDGYILTNKDNQKLKDNIVPLLENLVNDSVDVGVNILTKIKEIDDVTTRKTADQRYNYLNRVFANKNVKFSILSTMFANRDQFHDRVILTNFSLMQCGMGFNLNGVTNSNSELRNRTIFHKYTYKRLCNHMRMIGKYIDKLDRLETINWKSKP